MSKWRQFAKYNKASGQVYFNLEEELQPGLHDTKVTLTDGKSEVNYQLYLYVKAGSAIDQGFYQTVVPIIPTEEKEEE